MRNEVNLLPRSEHDVKSNLPSSNNESAEKIPEKYLKYYVCSNAKESSDLATALSADSSASNKFQMEPTTTTTSRTKSSFMSNRRPMRWAIAGGSADQQRE